MIQKRPSKDHREAPVGVDATSRSVQTVLDLPGFVVLAAGEYGGELELLVETTATVVHCHRCGDRAQLHDRREHLLRDVPAAAARPAAARPAPAAAAGARRRPGSGAGRAAPPPQPRGPPRPPARAGTTRGSGGTGLPAAGGRPAPGGPAARTPAGSSPPRPRPRCSLSWAGRRPSRPAPPARGPAPPVRVRPPAPGPSPTPRSRDHARHSAVRTPGGVLREITTTLRRHTGMWRADRGLLPL